MGHNNTMSPIGCVVLIENFRDGDRRVFPDKTHVVCLMWADVGAQLGHFSVLQEQYVPSTEAMESLAFRPASGAGRMSIVKMCATGVIFVVTSR